MCCPIGFRDWQERKGALQSQRPFALYLNLLNIIWQSVRAGAVGWEIPALMDGLTLPASWQADLQSLLSASQDTLNPQKEKSRLKFEMRQAGNVLANLQTAWRAATMDERAELCQIMLKPVVYDFERGQVVKVVPKPDYDVLFGLAGG